jgi:hypothetical protein
MQDMKGVGSRVPDRGLAHVARSRGLPGLAPGIFLGRFAMLIFRGEDSSPDRILRARHAVPS